MVTEAQRARINEQQRTRYAVNREKVSEYRRAYRNANRERVRERRRAYYETDREKISEKGKSDREKYSKVKRSIDERFWQKVEKRNPDECWLWKGAIHHTGYAHFGYGGRTQNAHRVAYILTYGAIPDGIAVCHRCDVRSCVNPSHLFLGTDSDNMQDMWNKQRHPRIKDTSTWTSKLSDEDVRQIHLLHQQGMRNIDIAARFHVRPSTTSRIINGVRRKAVS